MYESSTLIGPANIWRNECLSQLPSKQRDEFWLKLMNFTAIPNKTRPSLTAKCFVKMIPHMTEAWCFGVMFLDVFWGCFTPVPNCQIYLGTCQGANVYQVTRADESPIAFSAFGIVNHLLLCRPPRQARNNLPLNSTPANLWRVGAFYEGQERLQQETDAKVRAVA